MPGLTTHGWHDLQSNLTMKLRGRPVHRETMPERVIERSSWLVAGTLGAGAMYLLDPAQGKRRRAMARDRSAAAVRRLGRRLGHAQRRISADAYGLSQRVTHLRPAEPMAANDATLAQRVESELFRNPNVPKGRININAQNGIVVLRGVMERAEQIRDFEAAARKIPGVQGVKSYLHLPNTPSPNKQDALQAD